MTIDNERDEASLLKETATGSELVEDRMTEFAEFTVRTKLPHSISGLKLIQSRILQTIGTRDDRVKVMPLAGQVMYWHPHGDKAITDAITRLAQPFSDAVPLLTSDQNIGSYDGKSAAAGRYLEVWGSDFMKDVFFNRTNLSTLNLVPAEAGRGQMEYDYFIPCIPYALCTSAMGIAIGWKADVIPLQLDSICDLVVDYVKLKKQNASRTELYQKLAKHLLSDLICSGLIRNSQECYRHYANGEFEVPLVHDGVMEIHPNMIVLKSLPYGKAILPIHDKLGALLVSKKGFIAENFDSIDNMGEADELQATVECVLRRGVSPFDVLEEFKKVCGFEGSFTPIMNWYTPAKTRQNLNPIDILESWYLERSRSILADVKHTQNRLVNKHRELCALMIVVDHSREVVEIFNTAKTREDTIEPLVSRFGLTNYQATFLSGLTLGQLTSRGKDELVKSADKVLLDIQELQKRFVTIPETIMDDALYIKKTYGSKYPRRAKVPNFIGNLGIDGKGVIQFESYKELVHLERRFVNSDLRVTLYPKGSKCTYTTTSLGVIGDDILDAPKEAQGDPITVCKYKAKYTVVLNDGCIYRLNGTIPSSKTGPGAVFVGDTFVGITKTGKVRRVQATGIPLRKTAPAQGIMTDLVYVSDTDDDAMVVIHGNSSVPGELRVEQVTDGSNISKIPVGKTIVLGIVRYTDPWAVNIPPEIRPRGGFRHLMIVSNEDLFKGERSIKLALSKKSSQRSITPLHQESEIMTNLGTASKKMLDATVHG
jgi:DNA gyrase/topoisomerase IV subunit A